MPGRSTSALHTKHAGLLPTILILAGVAILVGVVFLLKHTPANEAAPVNELPESQMDWYLEHHRPVFVFYHSTTCKTCTDMMAVVDQVYPEFKERIGLVDVNVYQSGNEQLIRRAQITSIPTQVFINGKGQARILAGGMNPEQLRAQLQILAGEADDGN